MNPYIILGVLLALAAGAYWFYSLGGKVQKADVLEEDAKNATDVADQIADFAGDVIDIAKDAQDEKDKIDAMDPDELAASFGVLRDNEVDGTESTASA